MSQVVGWETWWDMVLFLAAAGGYIISIRGLSKQHNNVTVLHAAQVCDGLYKSWIPPCSAFL